jgi:hypothetical protein
MTFEKEEHAANAVMSSMLKSVYIDVKARERMLMAIEREEMREESQTSLSTLFAIAIIGTIVLAALAKLS